MMSGLEAHMDEVGERWLAALRSYEGNPRLMARVAELTSAFFARYPGLERTPLAERFITGLSLERALRIAPEASPETQTQTPAAAA